MMPPPASASRKTLGLLCMGLPGADIFVDLDPGEATTLSF
jgi:hypothetical protein